MSLHSVSNWTAVHRPQTAVVFCVCSLRGFSRAIYSTDLLFPSPLGRLFALFTSCSLGVYNVFFFSMVESTHG